MFYLLPSCLMTVLATVARVFWSCVWHISFLPQAHRSCVRKAGRTVPAPSSLTELHLQQPTASLYTGGCCAPAPEAQLLQRPLARPSRPWRSERVWLFIWICVCTREFRAKLCLPSVITRNVGKKSKIHNLVS